MTDPIADMLSRIRNALMVRHGGVSIPLSGIKLEICRVLKDEGYVADFTVSEDDGPRKSIEVTLRYSPKGDPAIRKITRVSKPSGRVYIGRDEIPRVVSGIGTAILSTSKGVMTGRSARNAGIGGEVLCTVV